MTFVCLLAREKPYLSPLLSSLFYACLCSLSPPSPYLSSLFHCLVLLFVVMECTYLCSLCTLCIKNCVCPLTNHLPMRHALHLTVDATFGLFTAFDCTGG